jgi:hypothetical protein
MKASPMTLRILLAAASVCALSAPALAQPVMGPHLDAHEYVQARGGEFGAAWALEFEVARQPAPAGYDARLAAEEAEAPELPEAGGGGSARTALIGPDWALYERDGERTLYDYRAERLVRMTGGTFANGSMHAAAQRAADMLAALSAGGSEDVITFDGVGELDRFWLEAAMGAAAGPAEVEAAMEGESRIVWTRGGHQIAAAEMEGCERPEMDEDSLRSALSMLNAAAPVHPLVLDGIVAAGALPCALSFAVYSPESPQGRIETWTLTAAELDEDAAPLALDLRPVLPDSDLLDGPHMDRALAAARGVGGAPLDPADFMELIEAAQDEGDHAGTWLLLGAEASNFGPCPEEAIGTERLVCAGAGPIVRAAREDEDFQQLMEAIAAAQEGAHRAALEGMLPHIEREDRAGAAARVMAAMEMIGWGREGLETYPTIDPAALLEQALALDPHAPDYYWHLGLRYLEAGAPEAAWALFDLGRALPGREPTPSLSQADRIEARAQALAPGFFPLGEPGEGESE